MCCAKVLHILIAAFLAAQPHLWRPRASISAFRTPTKIAGQTLRLLWEGLRTCVYEILLGCSRGKRGEQRMTRSAQAGTRQQQRYGRTVAARLCSTSITVLRR